MINNAPLKYNLFHSSKFLRFGNCIKTFTDFDCILLMTDIKSCIFGSLTKTLTFVKNILYQVLISWMYKLATPLFLSTELFLLYLRKHLQIFFLFYWFRLPQTHSWISIKISSSSVHWVIQKSGSFYFFLTF